MVKLNLGGFAPFYPSVPSSNDPDTLKNGWYSLAGIEADDTYKSKLPYTASASTRGLMLASGAYSGGKYCQVIYRPSVGEIYMRYSNSGTTWGGWYKFVGTLVE